MKQERIYYKRLKKLENHLRNGKLGHLRFDFGTIHDGEPTKNYCGTAGCAMGECPVVFPKDWEFGNSDYYGYVKLKKETSNINVEMMSDVDIALKSSQKFFGITKIEADHLFMPDEQPPRLGGKCLLGNATRKMVADNIKEFLKKCYHGPKR